MQPNDIGVIGIGHNQPPPDAPSPFEIAEKAVNDVYDETVLWLDGHQIDSQELADGVGNLLASIRKAEKQADEARVAEKTPLDEAIKEIQSRYAPLIGDTKAVKGKTVLAAAACKKALQPWLDAEDRRLRAEAEAKRQEADRQRAEAEAALRASNVENLAERAAAETLLADAKRAETVANVAARQTAVAGGAFGRAAGLRTVWEPQLVDAVIAARHYWKTDRAAIVDLMTNLAKRDIRLGKRDIPGFKISEMKIAV